MSLWHKAILAILPFLLLSCGVQKPTVVQKDSVRVEIRERIVHDTAYFQIPVDFQSVVVKDTASHLQNDYAASDASIEGGLLHHSLKTFRKTIEVPITVTVHDTTVVEHQAQTVYVDVPRQPTRWEHFLEGLGIFALALIGLAILLLIVKFALKSF